MNIISASRRTDIPAFYSEWFANRVREGYVRWPNPYGGKPCEVSLLPQDVSIVVFWSKNYSPLIPYLPMLESLGWGMIFHYTITGLPAVFETHVPPASVSVEIAHELAGRYSPEAVMWRYDPVLTSDITDQAYHLRRFEELAQALEGATRRCYFSFPKLYAKVARNIAKLRDESGVHVCEIPDDQRLELAGMMADIACRHGIEMHSCCGEYLLDSRIKKAHCVDAPLLHRLFPDRLLSVKERPTRRECGCYESKDIGAYDTCPHGCVYCYANLNKAIAQTRQSTHNVSHDMLTGDSGKGPFVGPGLPGEPGNGQGQLTFR
jgi:hypothetical protein